MNLYADHILDLYKHPLNQGKLHHATTRFRAFNPLCGDDITVDILMRGNLIRDIRHSGVGCAISMASVSLLTEEVKGKTDDMVMSIGAEKVIELLGVKLGPVRLQCALLGLEAIHNALQQWQKNRKNR